VTGKADLYGQRRPGAGADRRDGHEHGVSTRKSVAPTSASACAGDSAT